MNESVKLATGSRHLVVSVTDLRPSEWTQFMLARKLNTTVPETSPNVKHFLPDVWSNITNLIPED